MEDDQKDHHLILIKPSNSTQIAQHGICLKVTNAAPCQQKFELSSNGKREMVNKTVVGLNEQRKIDDNPLCDVVLIVEGKRIQAHRSVLAVQSEYFRAMFTSGMKESRSKEVEMHNTTYGALVAAIEFIYTGKFLKWAEDLKDVLATACMLQVDSLVTLCAEELTNYLDVSNCLGMFKFAEMYNLLKLQEKSEELIKMCFYSVMEEDEFVEMDAVLLTKIISWQGLNVGPSALEDTIIQAVFRWYKHNPSERKDDIVAVLKHVRISQVTSHMIGQLKEDKVVAENEAIVSLLDRAPICEERRQFSHYIYSIGGYRQSRISGQMKTPQPKSIEVLNTFTQEWTLCGTLPKILEPKTTLTLNGKLLIAKSNKCIKDNETLEMYSYNPVTDVWKEEPEYQGLTAWSSWKQAGFELETFVKALDEKNKVLYFCGNFRQTNGAPCRRVYQFDLVQKEVKELPSLPEARFHHGAIVLSGKLYVIGGNDWENTPKDTTFMYDPEEGHWATPPLALKV